MTYSACLACLAYLGAGFASTWTGVGESVYVMPWWEEECYLVGLQDRQVEDGGEGTGEAVQDCPPVAHVLLILHGLVPPSLKGAPPGAPRQGRPLPQELVPALASLHQPCTHMPPISFCFEVLSLSCQAERTGGCALPGLAPLVPALGSCLCPPALLSPV